MTLGYALGNIGVQIPILAILVVGLILTMTRRSRLRPGSAGLVIAGLSLLLVDQLAETVWSVVSYKVLDAFGYGSSNPSYRTYQIISWSVFIVLSLMMAVGILLLIMGLLRTAAPRGTFGAPGGGYPGQGPAHGFGPAPGFGGGSGQYGSGGPAPYGQQAGYGQAASYDPSAAYGQPAAYGQQNPYAQQTSQDQQSAADPHGQQGAAGQWGRFGVPTPPGQPPGYGPPLDAAPAAPAATQAWSGPAAGHPSPDAARTWTQGTTDAPGRPGPFPGKPSSGTESWSPSPSSSDPTAQWLPGQSSPDSARSDSARSGPLRSAPSDSAQRSSTPPGATRSGSADATSVLPLSGPPGSWAGPQTEPPTQVGSTVDRPSAQRPDGEDTPGLPAPPSQWSNPVPRQAPPRDSDS